MKKEILNTNHLKRIYFQPNLNTIKIDNEISLIITSPGVGNPNGRTSGDDDNDEPQSDHWKEYENSH